MADWSLYPNFASYEFACTHTDKCHMEDGFMARLQALRDRVGPLTITSGYRDPSHPVEAAKAKPGAHTKGRAADIQCYDSARRYHIVRHALELGFTGIGVSKDFIHLDDLTDHVTPRPGMWGYG